ncbi:hypothetical protein OC834_004505 [Tilletia horrida]|nr:hypothetical protein OC834_004505 [Tilletia horrida]
MGNADAGADRRRRPAGFEPKIDLSSLSLVPKRSVSGFESDEEDGAEKASEQGGNTLQLEWHARGLTSSVYKAELPSSGLGSERKTICVKVTSLDLLVRPHSAEREIACLSRLRGSKHVAELLDAFVAFPDPFSTNYELILTFYPFELGALLDDPTTTPEQWSIAGNATLREKVPNYSDLVLTVASGLAEGLQYMHKAGIAHRDIKPSNILLHTDGTPVYADFATSWESYKIEDGTTTGAMFDGDDGRGGLECAVGTGAYRAPEVLFSPADGYDVYKVDVWELGVTLSSFFMPFETASQSTATASRASRDAQSQEPGYGCYADLRHRSVLGSKAAQTPLWFGDSADEEADDDDAYAEEEEENYVFGAPLPKGGPPRRKTLFDGDRGEIALASSIFRILGLPEKQEEWPESSTFRPSFDRLPFERHAPTSPVTAALPLAGDVQALAKVDDNLAQLDAVLEAIEQTLQLSAAKRPDAPKLLRLLRPDQTS